MRMQNILLIIAFLLITAPGAIDSWTSLYERFILNDGDGISVSFAWGDIYNIAFPIVGLFILLIAMKGRRNEMQADPLGLWTRIREIIPGFKANVEIPASDLGIYLHHEYIWEEDMLLSMGAAGILASGLTSRVELTVYVTFETGQANLVIRTIRLTLDDGATLLPTESGTFDAALVRHKLFRFIITSDVQERSIGRSTHATIEVKTNMGNTFQSNSIPLTPKR